MTLKQNRFRSILSLFDRNYHHTETTCRKQDFSRYLEGQGHIMTLQQNRVRPITWLFEVWFYNYFTEIITILRRCVASNILVPWWSRSQHDLAAKSCPAHNFVIWCPILKYFTEMITILRRRVASNNWVVPWRSRSQHGFAAKACPAHKCVFWSWILQLFNRNNHCIEMMCHYLAHCLDLCVLYCIILSSVTVIASFSGLQEGMYLFCIARIY